MINVAVVSPNAKQGDKSFCRKVLQHEFPDVSITYRPDSMKKKPDVVVIEGQDGIKAAGLGTKHPSIARVVWCDKYGALAVQTPWMQGLPSSNLESVGRALKACVKGKRRPSERMEDHEVEWILSKTKDEVVGVDFETNGLIPDDEGILTVGIGVRENGRYKSYWFPIWHKDWLTTKAQRIKRTKQLVSWWCHGKRCVHHSKFELAWMDQMIDAYPGRGKRPDPSLNVYDTMMEKWLLDENTHHGLDWVSVQELGYRPYWTRLGPKDDFENEDLQKLGRYNGVDAVASLELHDRYWSQMTPKMQELCQDTLIPVSLALARMEKRGMHVSIPKLKKAIKGVEKQAAAIKRSLRAEWGEDLNFNSVPQMRHLLFEKLRLPVIQRTKKTGEPKMDADVLEELGKRDKNVALLSDYKKLLAKNSNVLRKLLLLAEEQEGVIHTNYNIGLTVTGRLSSSGPNLQNLERKGIEKTCFKSRFPNGRLLILDYKQCELRMCAIESKDDELTAMFVRDEDPHTSTWKECRLPSRDIAKNVNFSFISGISPYGLEQQFGIPMEDGRRYQKRWFKRHPGVGQWHETLLSRPRQRGYVEGPFGRRRRLPGIKSKDRKIRSEAERMGLNFPIQEGGADLMYKAMVKIERALEPFEAILIGQVHDSAIIDCPIREVKQVSAIAAACMKDFKFKVPLGVDVDAKKHL